MIKISLDFNDQISLRLHWSIINDQISLDLNDQISLDKLL